MPVNDKIKEKLNSAPTVKRGDAIFEGTDYPRTWEGMVGQRGAKQRLHAAIESAVQRGKPLDHILIASGMPGVGKTTLAQIVAYQAGVGLALTSGPMTVDQARDALSQMRDGDILFWDEIHLAVAGSKARAEWLLPFLQDGVLATARGAQKMPKVTVIGATTEAGKLQQTIIDRFMVQPHIVPYTAEEATQIVENLARRMKVRMSHGDQWVPAGIAAKIAIAGNCNPRQIRKILTAVRDCAAVGPVRMSKAFEWAGVAEDGLTREAEEMLMVLATSAQQRASIDTISAMLGEPGPMRHHEQILLQRGYIQITGRGRILTEDGVVRAKEAARKATA